MSMSTVAATPMSYHAGDEKTFTKVFNQFYPSLRYFAASLLNNSVNAEDIVEEVFKRFWEKGPNFQTMKQIKGWLYIATKNACFNYMASFKKKHTIENYTSLEAQEDLVLTKITHTEVLRQLYALIELLPRECKKVVKLGLKGYNNQEIAVRLNVSISTVKNQKSRAAKILRQRLSEQDLLALAIFFTFFGD